MIVAGPRDRSRQQGIHGRYTKGDMSLTHVDRTRGYASFAAAEAQVVAGQTQGSS
jgi:hypothetical protein